MSTHNLCFEQNYEKYQNFLSENFQILEMIFFYIFERACFHNVISWQTRVMIHGLMVLYTDVKFCENISNGIKVMEWTCNYEALTDGWMAGQRDTQDFRQYNITP